MYFEGRDREKGTNQSELGDCNNQRSGYSRVGKRDDYLWTNILISTEVKSLPPGSPTRRFTRVLGRW